MFNIILVMVIENVIITKIYDRKGSFSSKMINLIKTIRLSKNVT